MKADNALDPPAGRLETTAALLTMQALEAACRLFMERAYPDGRDTVPTNRRPYFDMTTDDALADYLPPAPLALGVCQNLCNLKGGVHGYEFRLGSTRIRI